MWWKRSKWEKCGTKLNHVCFYLTKCIPYNSWRHSASSSKWIKRKSFYHFLLWLCCCCYCYRPPELLPFVSCSRHNMWYVHVVQKIVNSGRPTTTRHRAGQVKAQNPGTQQHKIDDHGCTYLEIAAYVSTWSAGLLSFATKFEINFLLLCAATSPNFSQSTQHSQPAPPHRLNLKHTLSKTNSKSHRNQWNPPLTIPLSAFPITIPPLPLLNHLATFWWTAAERL